MRIKISSRVWRKRKVEVGKITRARNQYDGNCIFGGIGTATWTRLPLRTTLKYTNCPG